MTTGTTDAALDPRLSHVRGDTRVPLCEDTIGRHFDARVAATPDALALVSRHQGVRFTYRELARAVDDFGAGLCALGVAPGDRIEHRAGTETDGAAAAALLVHGVPPHIVASSSG